MRKKLLKKFENEGLFHNHIMGMKETTEQHKIFDEEKESFKKEYEEYIKLFENHYKMMK